MEVNDDQSVDEQRKTAKRRERETVEIEVGVEKKAKKWKAVHIGAAEQITATSGNTCNDGSGIGVSMFDCSAENHFSAMDVVFKVCGEADSGSFDETEIERLASSIDFLSEWRYFNYKPRNIRFVSETSLPNSRNDHNEINLPQFSTASVPKSDIETGKMPGSMVSTELRKDFVLHVGGLVWALDWCPMPDQGTHSVAKCEFVAVAAHPPDSTYHRLGACLNGQGMIQIWCLLNSTPTTEDIVKTKRKSQKNNVAKKEENKPRKPRGRPRKTSIDKTPPVADLEGLFTQTLVPLDPEDTSVVLPLDENILNTPVSHMPSLVGGAKQKSQNTAFPKEENKLKKQRGRSRKNALDKINSDIVPESVQALVIQLPEDGSNLHSADDSILNIPSPLQEKVNKQKPVTNEKNMVDKMSDVHGSEEPFQGQFVQALVVQPPEDISNLPSVDESNQNHPAPNKRKGNKRKPVGNGKNIADKTADLHGSEEPYFQALAVEFPENMSNILSTGENLLNTPASQEEIGRKHRASTRRAPASDLECTISDLKRRSRNKLKAKKDRGHDSIKLPYPNEVVETSLASLPENLKDDMVSGVAACDNHLDLGSGGCNFPMNVVLPRIVFCLGHDGKVAWDVKWRPVNTHESINKHRLGYLAAVLGNGTIEVWEIPSPQIIKCIYASRQGGAVDPRFVKLKPVFRCSTLKNKDKQSMPLTIEWSIGPPHDLILAGCHDGMVALWKFSTDCLSHDARPLLCFSAETAPIRTLSWAPSEGDPESSNIIATAGHGGLKFWDLRAPFRPLWDANPSQRFIYDIDWLPDPRCLILSHDDGTLKILCLARAAYDAPVTGEPFNGTQQQGLHSYYCSSFAIWSIHVSRRTGMVAYCSADGTVLYFQLTHKAVDKDPLRNRAPHFLCGALTGDDSAVAINSHLPSSPHRMKISATEWANTPRSARTVVSGLNQAKRVRKAAEKNQKPDDQAFALCFGDNSGNGDMNGTQRSSKSGKGKSNKSKKSTDDQALICTDEDGVESIRLADVKEDASVEIDASPPKLVSMYRVRWNMNKGSERWLCYGGAAGIVRCQEIIPPVVDRKLLRR